MFCATVSIKSKIYLTFVLTLCFFLKKMGLLSHLERNWYYSYYHIAGINKPVGVSNTHKYHYIHVSCM